MESVTQKDIDDWEALQVQLKDIRVKEMALRNKLFNFFFPNPKEGTNVCPLAEGWVVKGKHTIMRDIDLGAFTAYRDRLKELKINPDALVQFKPSLILSEYRKLTKEEQEVFDFCLIVRPGSPALEFALPARTKQTRNILPL